MTYDEIRPIFEKHFNSIVAFLEKGENELEEEASKQSKRKNDVYTEATPLALKVLVVDYQIHTDHNKPYYKIIRVDGTHQLFLSFISLLRNFDKEDLEMLWKIIQERFASSEPKNFSDDFLLNTLKTMFEKHNVKAHIWKNQRDSYGLAKVKSWKLLESCRVHIITFTTTQMILLHFNSIVAFLEKGENELEEEASKQSKRKNDVYTEATPLALKVLVVDYQIHTDHNKPYYKIIRVDGTHQLFLSFISLLRNFDKEDLEMLWKIIQERFASSEPKNFSDDFLLNTLKTMFEKHNVKAHIWKNQRDSYGLAKVKSWKLLESCRVHIITFTTTQMILLVERRYPLTIFTLD
nr:hypothetical protein [Tanacetum cinerariifolium]